MDPVAILGTAGAVLSIIDVLSRTLKSLRDLHNTWKDADHTIVNLMSQLIALRAALKKIAEWISSDLAHAPQHHQLVMDLEDSVTCCRMLIQTMDDQLSKLDSTNDDRLDIGSKICIVFEAKASQDFQTFIGRQISALTLLLTACNCKTNAEQKVLLEDSSSRQVFDQVRDDSSSLFVLCDTRSILSRWSESTGTSSRMSRSFQFDAQIMSSGVYQRAVRSLFKRTVRRNQENAIEPITSLSETRIVVTPDSKVEIESNDRGIEPMSMRDWVANKGIWITHEIKVETEPGDVTSSGSLASNLSVALSPRRRKLLGSISKPLLAIPDPLAVVISQGKRYEAIESSTRYWTKDSISLMPAQYTNFVHEHSEQPSISISCK